MIRKLSMSLQNLYLKIVPERIRSKVTPLLVKTYVSVVGVKLIHRKKKRLTRVDIRVTEHCNLNCKSCIALSPLADEGYVGVATVTKDFERLHVLTKGDIEEIHLKGGEPLLHPQLHELVRSLRRIFDKSRIILVTNGILLNKQDDTFWNVCKGTNAEIQISHYPIKIDFESILAASKKHGVKLSYLTGKPQVMFKWVFDPSGSQNAKKSFYKCFIGSNCFQIHDGRLYNCSLIPSIKYFNKKFNQNMLVTPEDSIDIHAAENFDAILEFSNSPIPFCRYCNANKCQHGGTWEVSKKDIGEWT